MASITSSGALMPANHELAHTARLALGELTAHQFRPGVEPAEMTRDGPGVEPAEMTREEAGVEPADMSRR
ncbi:hypothetical protein CH267_17020 [Rhodococcus sp. 06-621-2]|nr:hypothetical protein CH267_17020 [Rhodococcus sp. 06-621-2]OZD60221.1 hypothetical protein CH263_21400 [Rhodococcus sp. 06-1059B-a]